MAKPLAKLRCCMSCEWIYKGDPGECPKCGWPSYAARYVHGNKAYHYARNQKPWKDKKMANFEHTLEQEIKEALETEVLGWK